MLNITLTLTAAPELIAAISNITSALRYQNIENVKGDGSDFTSSKIQNEPRQSFEAVTVPAVSQAVKTEQYVQNQAPVVPTANQSYTMEQLAVAATQIVDAGHRAELVSLLASFGVQALTALPKEKYGAFATQLRALGAKI
jgi:hypothetical protein